MPFSSVRLHFANGFQSPIEFEANIKQTHALLDLSIFDGGDQDAWAHILPYLKLTQSNVSNSRY